MYVDDRKRLPLEEQEKIKTEDGWTHIRTVGNKNAYLQREMFHKASQPYLVLMTWEGEILTDPLGYNPDVKVYTTAVQTALRAFEEKQVALKKEIAKDRF